MSRATNLHPHVARVVQFFADNLKDLDLRAYSPPEPAPAPTISQPTTPEVKRIKPVASVVVQQVAQQHEQLLVTETSGLPAIINAGREMRLNKWSVQLLQGATAVKRTVVTDSDGVATTLHTWTTPNGEVYLEVNMGASRMVLYRDFGQQQNFELVQKSLK